MYDMYIRVATQGALRSYTRNVLIRSASRNGNVSDMHARVRDIVAYGNSDICALRK